MKTIDWKYTSVGQIVPMILQQQAYLKNMALISAVMGK